MSKIAWQSVAVIKSKKQDAISRVIIRKHPLKEIFAARVVYNDPQNRDFDAKHFRDIGDAIECGVNLNGEGECDITILNGLDKEDPLA